MKKYLLAQTMLCGLAAVLATPASAEFTFGGTVIGEVDYDDFDGDPTDTASDVKTNILAAYDNGEFRAGLGIAWDSVDDPLMEEDVFVLIGYGGFTVTYGDIYGGGSFTGDEYWKLDDTTSKSDETLRIDYQSDGFANHGRGDEAGEFSFALSLSNDLNGEDDDFEIGGAVRFGNTFVFGGYENDNEDINILFGQHRGPLTYHLVAQDDLDSSNASSTQLGGSLYYDVTDNVTLGGNLLLDGDGNYHSSGISAMYQSESGVTLFAEFMDEDNDNVTGETLEVGFLIPIGRQQPALDERMGDREYLRAHGF